MKTPIYDFVEHYAASDPVRLHMPGHKGVCFTGCEPFDLTEIDGADSLYRPDGIILESERNAAALFGTGETLYSTEGSSQCIRAMLYLAVLRFIEARPDQRPVIVAGRNAHKAFLTAAALLDFDIVWLYPGNRDYSLCRCDIRAAQVEAVLEQTPNVAGVFLTSPDYLGNMTDIASVAEVTRKKGVPLLVDNAHGAYLRFSSPSRHPITLGADICCDSAHKTLPVLTGGAYLHVAADAPSAFHSRARAALAMFGSTSPSYLILQSLDRANAYLADGYSHRLEEFITRVNGIKRRLSQKGWRFVGDEPMKVTLDAKKYGYTGGELAEILKARGIFCEYADPDYLVLMPTPESQNALAHLEAVLLTVEDRLPLSMALPPFEAPPCHMSVRQAMFLPSEPIPVEQARGRTVASMAVSCPPAISPAVPGEVVTDNTVAIYRYYGIDEVSVVAESAV